MKMMICKQHGMEMYKKNDSEHLAAMQEMMKNPEEMNGWFESKKKEFDALPNNG